MNLTLAFKVKVTFFIMLSRGYAMLCSVPFHNKNALPHRSFGNVISIVLEREIRFKEDDMILQCNLFRGDVMFSLYVVFEPPVVK